ncbi:hypothetical protein [Herbiconiux sp. YIM B11900]|uniref:hypothetical protein n=1 Tax=Herbiconiux sp. YIM B11900 TaxID=3404131 RepID=UPI003F849710
MASAAALASRSRAASSSVRIRMVSAALLISSGLGAFATTGLLLASPPAATLSSAKEGDVADIDPGLIEVSSSTPLPLTFDFATELHLSGTTRESYAFELRAPKTGFVDCGSACADEPLTLSIEFSGSADGTSYLVTTEDMNDLPHSLIHAAFASSTGAIATVREAGMPVQDLVTDWGSPMKQNKSVLQFHFTQTTFISHRADEGWKQPVVRIEVTPARDNAAQSGSYFAVQAPTVSTIRSNVTLTSASPFNESGLCVFWPIPLFGTVFGITDDTGAAILTGGVESENSWHVNPASLPDGSGPVVSYIDHRRAQLEEFWRQGILLVSATLIGTAFAICADLFFGKRTGVGVVRG